MPASPSAAPVPPSETESLGRGALALGSVAVGGYLADYALNLGLARLLAPHEYGDYKLAFAFASFFGLAVLLGGDRAAPMVLAPCVERHAGREVWEYLRYYLQWALGLSVGLILVTWVAAFLHLGHADPIRHHPLAWAALAVPFNAAGALVSRTLQSARRPAEAVLPWRLGFPLGKLGLVALWFAIAGPMGVHEVVVLGIAMVIVIVLGQWRRVRRLGLVELGPAPDFRAHRAWLAMSTPMMGSFLVALALNQSDLYFLEWLGDEAELGLYAAAAVVAHLLTMVQVTVIGLVAPLARPAIDGGARASHDLLRRGLRLMLGLLVPLALVTAAAGEPILGLYGARYRSGEVTLLWLLVGNFAWATAALSSLWLQYRGRPGVVLAISIVTLGIDSALNLVLIPRFGMDGAAAGTALTMILASATLVFAHLRLPPPSDGSPDPPDPVPSAA